MLKNSWDKSSLIELKLRSCNCLYDAVVIYGLAKALLGDPCNPIVLLAGAELEFSIPSPMGLL